jgi:hypothetical protein
MLQLRAGTPVTLSSARAVSGVIGAAPWTIWFMLLSAVDTNASRRAIQGLYPPRLLSASTHDMRAELLRCDPRAQTACIHCYNPVRDGTSDDQLRRRFGSMTAAEQGTPRRRPLVQHG